MRKILSIIILTFCFHTSKAEEIIIYLGEAYHYNEFLGGMSDAQFAIKYDTENKIYYFYSSDIFNKGWVKMTESQLGDFRSTLEKYLQWEKTAIEKKVKINKEFPDSELNCNVSWKFGDDWFSSSYFKM